jgi:hypothetical protein
MTTSSDDQETNPCMFQADPRKGWGEDPFDITVAEAEAIIEPDPVTDDLGRKSMVLVRVG